MALIAVFFIAPLGLILHQTRDLLPSQWSPFAALDLAAPDSPIQRWKVDWAEGSGDLCRAAIRDAGVEATPRKDERFSYACSLFDSVSLTRLGGADLKPVDLRCAVAMRLYLWEKESVQPAAQRIFGEPVVRLLHFGGYSCRRIAGSWFWSRHAVGDAIDISGFRFKSGRVITLTKHWNAGGEEAEFLRAVRDGACRQFVTVLGPDYNAAHRDHFHFDLGWWDHCG